MTSLSFLVIIASLVALLVVGTEDIGSGHTVYANRAFSGHGTFTNKGINVQTETNQDQGCEGAGGTSGITNACTATSGRGSTEAQVTLEFLHCTSSLIPPILNCNTPFGSGCNNIGCTSISCTGGGSSGGSCTTDNNVQLSCTHTITNFGNILTCTRIEPGTGITQSGGVSGG